MITENTSSKHDYAALSKQQLIADFKVVVADAEALIQATAAQGGEVLAHARTKATESLNLAKAKMEQAQAALAAKTQVAADATDEYVRAHPWESVGVAAAAGLLVGLIIARR